MQDPVKKLLSFLFIATAVISRAQPVTGYWQQEVHYVIHVTLNDSTNFLRGDISIEYINHSSDTLHYIWFHLWPNAYKNTSTAFAKQEVENGSTEFQFSNEKDKGYINGLSFKVNGSVASLQYDDKNIDIAKLVLNEPLLPGEKIMITTPFEVKIPRTFSRFGHVGQSYQVTQWYPKPAVYDRYGWHQMPYLDQGEFFSEFGSFDVSITLPKNYVVGATGVLQDEEEKKWLDSLAEAGAKKFAAIKAATGNPAVDRLGKKKFDNEFFPPSSLKTKTIHYLASNVHDFAWFADKRYNVMKSTISLPAKKNPVITWTMFTDQYAPLWKNAIRYVDSSVYYYSKWLGDYPYPQATAVEGALEAGDGMEYPMITVISGGFNGVKSLETVVAHEVGHNWLYGVLAFNEREHPWMDEGINSYYENRYVETRYPHEGLLPANTPSGKIFNLEQYPRSYQNYLLYIFQANRRVDQPMDIHATEFTKLNYAAIVYSKTAEVWKYLEAYLGTETYDRLMREFYEEWKFKHPYPIDVKNFFEEKTNKELGWLFDQLIPTTDYLDYKLVKAKDTTVISHSAYQKLVVVNKADVKGPYAIDGIRNGKVVNEIWYGGFNGKMEVLFPQDDYDAYRIDAPMNLPEVNRKNNTVRTSGILRNMEKLRVQWLGSVDNPQRTQLFFAPVPGWNNYDKSWLGLALYNSPLQNKPFSFLLIPAYGFGSNKFIGLGQMNLQLFPKSNLIHRMDITSSAKSFDYATPASFGAEGDGTIRFLKFTQQLNLTLENHHPRNLVDENILFRNIFIKENNPLNSQGDGRKDRRIVNQVTYSFQDSRILNPFGFSISTEGGVNETNNYFLKTYFEGNYRIHYPKKKTGLDIRVFTGLILVKDATDSYTNFHLGPTTGPKDYRFDEVYLGRMETDGALSQQIAVADDGGFKMRTDGVSPEIGRSNTWILALNLKAPIPFLGPFFVFADGGVVPNNNNNVYQDFQYDAGVGIKLIPDVIEVYLPFLFSSDIKQYLNTQDLYNSWYKRISFTFNIQKLNPFEYIKNLKEF